MKKVLVVATLFAVSAPFSAYTDEATELQKFCDGEAKRAGEATKQMYRDISNTTGIWVGSWAFAPSRTAEIARDECLEKRGGAKLVKIKKLVAAKEEVRRLETALARAKEDLKRAEAALAEESEYTVAKPH